MGAIDISASAASSQKISSHKSSKRKRDLDASSKHSKASKSSEDINPSDGVSEGGKKSPQLSIKKRKASLNVEPSTQSAMSSSPIVSNQTDFPRGGGMPLTPLEVKAIKHTAERETLFSESPQSKTSTERKKRKRSNSLVSSSKSVGPSKTIPSSEVRVESLNFKRLTVGTLLLTQVQSINSYDLTLSLPNQLVGTAHATDLSDEYSERLLSVESSEAADEDEDEAPVLQDLYQTGQWLTASVIRIESAAESSGKASKKVVLSINPSVVNAAVTSEDLSRGMILNISICSAEDHGYVVNTGIEGVRSFLPYAAIQSPERDRKLDIGQVIQCSIDKVSSGNNAITFQCKQDIMIKSTLSESIPNISSLLPGTAVYCNVAEIHPKGLLCDVMGIFKGTIDVFHIDSKIDEVTIDVLQSKYPLGKKLRARILYFCPSSEPKRIGLSLAPHIISQSIPNILHPSTTLRSPLDALPIGTVFEKVTVIRVEPGWGLLCKIDNLDLNGFVYISRVSDDHVATLPEATGPYKIGSTHRARVLGYAGVDGLLQLSLQESVLNSPFLRVQDVEVGSIIRGTVETLTPHGVFISLSSNINGLASSHHLSDVKLSHPERKFKPGDKVKCRVLAVDLDQERIALTLKKSLLDSQMSIIKDWADSLVNTSTVGTIISIKDHGCIVEFFNRVRGYCPKMASGSNESLWQRFKVGQTVKCTVTEVDRSQNRLRVAFGETQVSALSGSDFDAVHVGSFTAAEVVSKNDNVITVRLQPSGVHATLPANHLSDHLGDHCRQMMVALKVGATLSEVLIVSKNKDTKAIFVTMKPLLIAAAKHEALPSEIDERLLVGAVIPGFVRNVTEIGVFVGFQGDLTGLALKHAISDQYISSTADLFENDQTVLALISDIDHEQGRIQLSLKPSQVSPFSLPYSHENDFAVSYFEELASINTSQDRIKIGSSVKATVKEMLSYGWLLDLGKGIEGFATMEQTKGMSASVGQEIKAKILDFDVAKKIADLSVRPDIFSEAESTALKKGGSVQADPLDLKRLNKMVKKSQSIDAIVELVKEDYLAVRLTSAGNIMAFAMTKSYNNRFKPFLRYKPGQKARAKVIFTPDPTAGPCDRVLVALEIQSKHEVQNRSSHWTLKKPIDDTITGVDDLAPGQTIKVRVKSVKETQINVEIAENLRGRVHITEIFDYFKDIKDKRNPLKKFSVHQVLDATILGWHDARTHKYLAISRSSMTEAMLELSLKSLQPAPSRSSPVSLQISDLKVGETVSAFVNKVSADGLWVNLSPSIRGRIFSLHVSSDPRHVSNLSEFYPVGSAVQAKIIAIDNQSNQLDLSILALEADVITDFDSVKLRGLYAGRIQKIMEMAMIVNLSEGVSGRVHVTDVSDKFRPNPMNAFKKGQIIKCSVVNVDKSNRQVDLSLRQSDAQNVDTIADPSINDIAKVKTGDVYHGFVKHVSDGGVFVSISRNLDARVKIAELSDEFLTEWKTKFLVGQLVQGKILQVDSIKKQLEMTLKSSKLNSSENASLTVADLTAGQKIKGTIKKIERYGVFIKVLGSSVSGLCHVSEISDSKVNDISKLYSVGDPVKALVIGVDSDDGKVSFGLKASYFEDDDVMSEDLDDEASNGQEITMQDWEEEEDASDEDELSNRNVADSEDAEMDDAISDQQSSASETPPAELQSQSDDEPVTPTGDGTTPKATNRKGLTIAKGFSWDGEENVFSDNEGEEENSCSDEDTDEKEEDGMDGQDDQVDGKRSKSKKKKAALQQDLTADLADKAPNSVADYERLLLASPNSSFLWVNYMAFQLQLSEIDKARAIGERALKTINFRQEQEKGNVWVALLNLENSFGDDESLDAVFKRCIQMSDAKKAYLALVNVLDKSGKKEKAEEVWKQALKKFGQSSKVWVLFGEFYLSNGRLEDARELLARSTKVLPKRKHVKTISKFGQMEFKYGEAERGRTIFEGMLSQYPKRTDLWNVYLDMEQKYGSTETVRALFTKITGGQKLVSKTAKHFFKRWLAYEKENGSLKSIDEVKLRAIDYVEGRGQA